MEAEEHRTAAETKRANREGEGKKTRSPINVSSKCIFFATFIEHGFDYREPPNYFGVCILNLLNPTSSFNQTPILPSYVFLSRIVFLIQQEATAN